MVGVGPAALVIVTSALLLVIPPGTVPEVMEPGVALAAVTVSAATWVAVTVCGALMGWVALRAAACVAVTDWTASTGCTAASAAAWVAVTVCAAATGWTTFTVAACEAVAAWAASTGWVAVTSAAWVAVTVWAASAFQVVAPAGRSATRNAIPEPVTLHVAVTEPVADAGWFSRYDTAPDRDAPVPSQISVNAAGADGGVDVAVFVLFVEKCRRATFAVTGVIVGAVAFVVAVESFSPTATSSGVVVFTPDQELICQIETAFGWVTVTEAPSVPSHRRHAM